MALRHLPACLLLSPQIPCQTSSIHTSVHLNTSLQGRMRLTTGHRLFVSLQPSAPGNLLYLRICNHMFLLKQFAADYGHLTFEMLRGDINSTALVLCLLQPTAEAVSLLQDPASYSTPLPSSSNIILRTSEQCWPWGRATNKGADMH